MKEEFAVGDTVYLKSGSPRMTVAHVHDEHADVTWITNGGCAVMLQAFKFACLTKTEPRRTS